MPQVRYLMFPFLNLVTDYGLDDIVLTCSKEYYVNVSFLDKPFTIFVHFNKFALRREVLMRGIRLVRFFRAITLLSQPTGTTIEEIGRRLEIEKRQVYRILKTLQDNFGLVLNEERLDGGGKRISLPRDQQRRLSDIKVPDLNITMGEIVALHFLRGHASLYKGTGVGEEIDQAFTKLAAFVPEALSERLERMRTLFVPSVRFAKDYHSSEDIIENVSEGILSLHTCLVEYHSFTDNETKHFRIDPLRFFERDGGLYLFVRATRFDDIRILAVERIKSIELTEDSFVYPKNFNPEVLLQESFGMVYDDPLEVEILFSADQARYIRERQWAQEQKITKRKDGSVVLWMKTSGWHDVLKWVLSFGSDACVLSPADLQEKVRSEAEKMVREYSKAMA